MAWQNNILNYIFIFDTFYMFSLHYLKISNSFIIYTWIFIIKKFSPIFSDKSL
jgi:hypothetical protein